jgi:hypothetical protein
MFVASPDKDIWEAAKRMPGHATDKRGGLRQRGSKMGQTAPGERVAVVQLPANVALLVHDGASVFLNYRYAFTCGLSPLLSSSALRCADRGRLQY